MAGTFYGIGVGPGDPELLTMKLLKLLKKLECTHCTKNRKKRW